MIRKNRITISSSILLGLAVLLTFTCKTPADPGPSIFPLIPETGPVKMLVFRSNSGLSAYNLLTGEEQLFLEPGPLRGANPGDHPYYRSGMGNVIWHPGGRSVIYEEIYGDDEQHIQSLDIISGDFIFGERPDRMDELGHVSSNGNTLVFARSVFIFAGNYEIFSMSLDDLVETRLTNRPGYWDSYPTIHPNGHDIIFESTPHWIDSTTPNMGEIGAQLYHMTLDGDSITKIVLGGYANKRPNFNPVTEEIVYIHSDEHHIFSTIWKATDMTFSDGVQLTDTGNISYGLPNWSNDGNKIVYTLYRDRNWNQPEIWMMNADGSGKEKIIQNRYHGSLFIRE